MKNTYLKVFLILCILIFGTVATAHSQEITSTSKRVVLTNPSLSQLQTLQGAGLDLHCGAKFEGNDLRLDLQFPEVQILEELGVPYQILEDNLTQFYVDRYMATRDEAEAQLRTMKEQSLQNKAERSSLSTGNASVESFIQREECTEVDWVSQNFILGDSFGGCLTVDQMIAELDRMRTLYPNLISMRQDASPTGQQTHGNTTGTAFDPQTIWYVRISDNPDIDEQNEPESLITGMTHAREVNSMMNVIYYMWWVLENYESDPAIKNLVDNQEMYFIPIVNPDGVKWNEIIAPQGGGLQRKNLRPGVNDLGSTTCTNTGNQTACNALRGVDLNRNSSYYWGFDNVGSSPTQSRDTYRGPFPASEPETQILADFVASRDFEYAINHHSGINSIVTSSYNGDPNAAPSGREDEYQKLMHDATRFNRYIHGSAPNTLTSANGDTNDYMLGGPPVTYTTFIDADGDNQGSAGSDQIYTSTGSGKNIITFSPENGDDFWPPATDIIIIAQRAVRMNLLTSLYAGKYARLHDFTKNNINSLNPTINFEVEYLGQAASDLTLTITPVSSNITAVTQPTPGALNGMDILEQRPTSGTLTLDAAIAQNDLIEYQVTLSNDTYTIYEVTYTKYYNPTIEINGDGFNNWTASGTNNTWSATTDGYNGSTNAITSTPSAPYGNNILSFVTLDTPVDLSTTNSAVIQFNAKWDIERNFDLVQFEASVDGGSSWQALCGKYTKVSSGEQGNFHLNKSASDQVHQENNSTLIYDGDLILDPNATNTPTANDDVDKWVLEEFLLDNFTNVNIIGNSNVLFRFRFDTDSSNRSDGYDTNFEGFTFDDFQITTLSIENRCIGDIVSTFPAAVDFENGLAFFTQASGDDGNWLTDTGGTPSGGTGPTTGTNGETYLYVEASNSNTTPGGIDQGGRAILNSNCIDFTTSSSAALSFDYHMQTTGNFNPNPTLNVQITTDDGTTWTNLGPEIEGSPANQWNTVSYDLSAFVGAIARVRFVGLTGVGSFQGDIAIDNLVINTTIDDTIPPTALCQDLSASLGSDGTVTILAAQIDNGSSDDMGIASLTLDIDTFDCSQVGTNDVVLTVTDLGGNTATCMATVTIAPYTQAPDGLMNTTILAASASLSWNAVASSEYSFRFRESGTTPWTTTELTTNTIDLNNLDPETTYEAQIRANCSTGNTPYSESLAFTTTAINYCQPNVVGGVDAFDITNVSLGTINNTTGTEPTGYGDYLNIQTDLQAGSTSNTITITANKTFNGNNFNVSTFVWIDFNYDGIFDQTQEAIVSDQANTNTTISQTFTVPVDASLGLTRMRVSLKFNSANDTPGSHTDPCADFNFGEYEDYTINLTPQILNYVYDAGTWSPNDPSGIATSSDTITVVSGTGELTANTAVQSILVQAGATLDIGTTTLTIDEDLTNNGTITAAEASMIFNGTTSQSVTGTSFELGNLTIDNPSGVTISGGVELKNLLTLSTGALTSNGTLTFRSDINGSAMVAPITGGSIIGDVITEQYVPAKRAFRLIGSTVTTTSPIQANWQESLSPSPSFGTHITGSTDGSNGFDATGSGNHSLFTLNNAGQVWEAVTNTDVNTLVAGQPLRLLVRGDRTIDLSSNASPATSTTLRATGQLATGTFTTTGSSLNHTANAFNLIGNPYQASVNINDVLTASTNINSNQIFVWDATLGARGQYVTVTLDGVGSSNGATSKNYHFLQPGQAVFTRTLSTVTNNSTTIVFAENYKAVGQNIPVYVNETSPFSATAHLIGRLYRTEKYGTDEGLQDNFVALYSTQSDNAITPVDASKFFNIDENMAIAHGDTLLSVEHRGMPQEGEELQFFNTLYRASNYTLDIDIAGLEGVTAYFIDAFAQTTTPLSDGLNTINFIVNQDNEASIAVDRFKIVYQTEALNTDDLEPIEVSLYPNPVVAGVLNLSAPRLNGQDAQLVIYNLLGQRVYTAGITFTASTATIKNLNHLQTGVYFVTIQNDTIKSTQRILVK